MIPTPPGYTSGNGSNPSARSPFTLYPAMPTGTIVLQPNGYFQTERTGLAIQRERYIGNYTDLVGGKPLIVSGYGNLSATRISNSPHPFFPSLLLYSSKVTRGKGALGIWDAEYRGLDPALSQIPPPIYTLELSTSNEPISTHPNFKTTLAGTPGGPGPGVLNGASFVDKNNTYNPTPVGSSNSTPFDWTTATFAGWLAKSKYAGVEDYLAPRAIWKSTYVSYSPPPDLGNFGSIENPDGPVPILFGANYNWLNVGISYTDNSGLFRIEKSWMLSGQYGWDTLVYPGAGALAPPGTLSSDGTVSGGD